MKGRGSVLLALLLALAIGCTPMRAPLSDLDIDTGGTPASTDLQPVAALVRRTDLSLAYRLDGVTAESTTIGLDAAPPWQLVTELIEGDSVERGDLVGRRVVQDDLRTALTAAGEASGIERSRLEALLEQEADVQAAAAGAFTSPPEGPGIVVGGIDVVVPLSPLQELRYRSVRFSGQAEVETVLGPRTVDCVALWRSPATASPGLLDELERPAQESMLHCRLPNVAETAPGLRAQLLLRTEPLLDVLVVPNAFLGYDEAADTYTVTTEADGRPTTTPVTTGITDGVVRVVDGDLREGARLLPPPE